MDDTADAYATHRLDELIVAFNYRKILLFD
jgi:hypothetical protein